MSPLSKPLAALCLALPFAAYAQAISPAEESAPAVDNQNGPTGIVPYVKGFNFSLGTTSQHDSAQGWSSILTPDLAYRLNSRFSFDATTPIYAYTNVEVNSGTKARPVDTLQTKHFTPDDTQLNAHFEVNPSLVSYNLTATLGLPTGSKADGLGAGQVTYAFTNHFEKSFSLFTPDIELGLTDSSQLTTTRVRKDFTAVGTQAYFQAGTSVDLTHNLTFSADAYEDLPLSSETLYSTTGKGKKKVTTATNAGVAEDNGFLTSLDIPLTPHVTLSGFYNRSLRNKLDTAGFSFTFFLKAPPRETTR